MKKSGFWKADWFLGVVVTLLVLATVSSDLVQSLERKAYDLGVKATSRTPSDKIAVIAIDKQSIDNIGRWPWPDPRANVGASALHGHRRHFRGADRQRPALQKG